MNTEFWRGRKVLLTGHTGFKGAWLALWLDRLGAEVTGFALEPEEEPNLYTAARVGRTLDSVIGDVRDGDALARTLAAARPEVVLHLAAQSLVRRGYEDPIGTYSTNVMGTAHLLEAVRFQGEVRSVVAVTTDKCYENREWVWSYREGEHLGGRDPYSSSKACAELVTAAYRASFFAADGAASLATARAGNVIGGGDWARDRLVPDIARAAAAGREVRIRSPRAIRPWQHVLEPLAGYLLLAERLADSGSDDFAEAWNFGPEAEDCRSVEQVLGELAGHWPELAWSRDEGEHPHEATTLKLDSSKAKARLGWRPRLPLDRALGWVGRWYRTHAAGGDARDLALEQIERYEALLDAP